MWKILPLLLFAIVALFSYRYCSHTPVAESASISPAAGGPASGFSSIDSANPDTSAVVIEAAARTRAALSGLTANSSAEDLVKALNLNIVDFSPGSSELPADQIEVLKKAAEAIGAAPSGTRLEVGGHTDNQGEAAENLRISALRADRVKGFLVEQGVSVNSLVSKGYGDTRPVAGNDTVEGRFRNRRIEFSIVR